MMVGDGESRRRKALGGCSCSLEISAVLSDAATALASRCGDSAADSGTLRCCPYGLASSRRSSLLLYRSGVPSDDVLIAVMFHDPTVSSIIERSSDTHAKASKANTGPFMDRPCISLAAERSAS